MYDVNKCGDLREYSEYDRDYPDDDRICEDIIYLQCRNDFLNLDELAEGKGSGGDAKNLVIETKVFAKKNGKRQYLTIIFFILLTKYVA